MKLRRWMLENGLLFDKGEGGGGDNGGDGGFQRLAERYQNDTARLAETLYRENYQHREKIRQLEAQAADLQGKAPPEGAVVLKGAEAQAWAAYQALGTADEIKQGLDKRTELQGKLETMEREGVLRDVATAAGYKPAVLAQLDRMAKAQGKALAFEVRDMTVDGAATKAAFVKDGDKESPLADYATANWADFLPALSVQPQSGQQQNGTPFPMQHAGSGGQKPQTTKAVAESYVAKSYRRPTQNGENR